MEIYKQAKYYKIINIVLSRKNKLEAYELTRVTFACIISVPRRSQATWKKTVIFNPQISKNQFFYFNLENSKSTLLNRENISCMI